MQTKEERERRGVPLSVRIAKSTHDELNRLARAGDKSVTQTVERLLDRALRDEQRTADILEPALRLKHGPLVAKIVLAVGEALDIIGAFSYFTKFGKGTAHGHWCADPWAFDQAVKAVQLVLDHARPRGEIVPPPPVEDEERAGKFWKMSSRYLLDHPLLDDLRRALAGEAVDPESDIVLTKTLKQIAARLNDTDGNDQ